MARQTGQIYPLTQPALSPMVHHVAHCGTLSSNMSFYEGLISRLAEGPSLFHFILTFVGFLVAAKLVQLWRLRQRQDAFPPQASTPTLEKSPRRQSGHWIRSSFRFPTPDPYPDWSIETTKPLPYRPFRYGPVYHVTMGLRKAQYEDWIELDNQFPKYHAEKQKRIALRGEKSCKTHPEAHPAAMELLQEFREYLPARYPALYQKTERGLKNLWSGEDFDFEGDEQGRLVEDPMQMAARLVQDDLAIMMEREDGNYYLLAGATLLPGFWRLEDKFGMGLSEIHTSGDVPQYKEKLEKGMMSFFRRVKPQDMVARNNYFFQVDDRLGWSWSIGPEDSPNVSWATAEKNRAIEHHYFRSERQTLRRLPKSGGVVFTIRTYFHPVTEIAEEDYVPGRLASAVRSWREDVSRYKGKDKYQDVLLEYLDKKHQEQLDKGLDQNREDEVRAYPY